MTDQSSHDVRLGQVHRMATPGNEGSRTAGRRVCQAKRVSGESGVIGSGQSEEGRSKVGYAIPQRLLRARAGQPQARRQTRCGVAQALVCLGRIVQADEHRAADPLLDESLDISRILECRRGGLVRFSPLLAADRVLHAPGAADQDEPTDIEVRAGHDMKGDPRAEGVAQEITRAGADRGEDGIAHQSRCRREIGAHRVRSSVAGQVDADESAVLRQKIAEGTPQTPRLCETVQKDERRSGARTALFDLESHAW